MTGVPRGGTAATTSAFCRWDEQKRPKGCKSKAEQSRSKPISQRDLLMEANDQRSRKEENKE